MANRLEQSLSPYLRQHAENPVDWWEWSPEAFDEARRRDVPVFLSIGYAACHWCHVMAHESFEDPATAAAVNERFVAVKVDREERPDVDAVYMDVTVALTGHGGWPMSVWLTPQGDAFHAGTYFPATPHPQMPSFRQVLDAVHEAWTDRRADVESGATHITDALAERAAPPPPGSVTAADVDAAVALLAGQHDDVGGGFGSAPKFPPSMVLDALVRRASADDGPVADEAWRMARATSGAMAGGGMYDQLGGGFARYSVDAAWVVPHFEKMLSDNALLLGAYARVAVEAARRGEDPAPAERVVTETVAWLAREMRTPEGAFAASLDADSADADGHLHEGAFYAWTPAQLVDVLGDDAARAADVLGVTEPGTFEHGASVLQRRADPDDTAWFARVRDRLLAAREERSRPARDDKVVAAWNGWTIASLVDAAVLLDRPDWLDLARGAATAVHTLHTGEAGRLARVSLAGRVSPASGAADDHGALAQGFLLLGAATGDDVWSDRGLALLERLHERFAADDGGLFDTADDAERLVRRPREAAENASPSGASAALRATRLAARLTGEARWRERADTLARSLGTLVSRAPRAAGWALADAVAEQGARPPLEVAVIAPAGLDTAAPDEVATLVRTAWRDAPAGSVVAVGAPGSTLPLLAGRPAIGGRVSVYVCRDHVCALPVTDLDGLRRQLA